MEYDRNRRRAQRKKWEITRLAISPLPLYRSSLSLVFILEIIRLICFRLLLHKAVAVRWLSMIHMTIDASRRGKKGASFKAIKMKARIVVARGKKSLLGDPGCREGERDRNIAKIRGGMSEKQIKNP